MPKLPGVNHLDAIRALQKMGFRIVRQGKHTTMSDGSRLLTIPRHNPINAIAMGNIVRDAGQSNDQYGFGVGRMVREQTPTENGLAAKRNDQPIPLPSFSDARSSAGDKVRTVSANDSAMYKLHYSSLVDFVYSDGFGYFKDRHHVAGFQSHRFSKVPEPDGKLQVISIELIGWLRGAPRAYVSENLPAMQELRNAPTRPLDIFEEEGLAELRGGKDIFVKDRDLGVRALGSIRATKQCIDCHGGERGDLLGAFSYRLR